MSRVSKEKNREYCKAHYSKNKARYLERNRRRAQENAEWIRELKCIPCMDCGITYPHYVMDFDHRDGSDKKFDIASNARRLAKSTLQKEIEKCDIVCSNCHRERTYHWRSLN